MNDIPSSPSKQQFGTARDAATFARLVLADQQGPAHDMIQSLLDDPESVPGVMYGLAGMVAHALVADPDTKPETFFEGVFHMLDAAESGEG